MNHRATLTVTSLLSILLFSVHFADDMARGFETGDLSDYTGILIIGVWLFATLVICDRRMGLVIILMASIGAAGVPAIHMTGAGMLGGRIAGTSGILFWAWTLIALGATGMVSAALAARGLWRGL